MANKIVYAVYQDCVLCGDKGKKVVADFAQKGIDIIKVSFISGQGRELCEKAVMSHGIKTMPFFTDGTIFATSLESFTDKPAPKVASVKNTTRKNKKVKKGKKDGNVPEV
jgi:hypothetical protein